MLVIPKKLDYLIVSLIKKYSGAFNGSGSNKKISFLKCFFLLLSIFSLLPTSSYAKFTQLDMVLDVKSRFSDGCSSIQELASLAQHRGINVMILSDHYKDSIEYGITPFERILKSKSERPSVSFSGINTYLSEISQNNKTFSNVLLLPSVESAPFYYWTGNIFKQNLVAQNWNKHLGIIGLENPKDYEGLPILNGNFSKRYVGKSKVAFLVSGVLFFVSIILIIFFREKFPKSVYLFLIISILLLLNNHPFKSSPFNPYKGDQKTAPYQEMIDYVTDRGGMVFWNHIATDFPNEARGESSKITQTPPHPTDLLFTHNYTGFQSVNDTPVNATNPGSEWDQTLMPYLNGKRAKPVWGYGSNDFHCEGQDGHKLGGVRTIALVSENSDKDVFNALRTGRMYSVRSSREGEMLSLDEFSIVYRINGNKATLGQELEAITYPEINIDISSTESIFETVNLTLIRNGEVIKQETASLPYNLKWRDVDVDRMGMTYYRLKAESGSTDMLMSNPVFVKFTGKPNEVASILEESEPAFTKRKRSKIADPTARPESFEEQVLKTFDNQPPTPIIPSAPQKKLTIPSQPEPPVVEARSNPVMDTSALSSNERPSLKRKEKSTSGRYVVSTVNNLILRKGPGKIFPSIGRANKGDTMLFIRRTDILLDGKPWIVVKKNKQMYYVWEGLTRLE
jgi:hypothetical protein